MTARAIEWTPARDVVGAYRVGHSKPNGHPADGMTAHVCIGGGAFSTIPNPQSYENGGIVWTLTWGNADAVKFTAGSLITSYAYLLSDSITMKEATSRLRLLRKAYQALGGRSL
jgi:hypothetical protein